ncbi:MAG: hypothetical protein AAGJ80_14525, partial [Cyanobacteria bacterium J06553_1]
MIQAIQLKNHPFRFLLYLEWGLLLVAIVSALETPPARRFRQGVRQGVRQGARNGLGDGIRPHLHGGGPPHHLFFGWEHGPLIAIVPLIIFGLMGLYLPARKLPKLGHTLGQILLILFASAAVFND